ncbi:hypothetical protein GUJ93_ZPchr0006g41217 [Zizania palustris]|uniref:Uncharacterized protein n=1 Tax=Zizania palustris TaxID=103762 RepID=A0A8J5TC55_ZIZPA|nr:hypothetical protein GUJ93_ZPchr0006g41217 [Zizania palustris]
MPVHDEYTHANLWPWLMNTMTMRKGLKWQSPPLSLEVEENTMTLRSDKIACIVLGTVMQWRLLVIGSHTSRSA